MGWIIERIDNPKTYQFILASLAGLLVVYLIGVPYLYMALNVWMGIPSSWAHVWMIGFVYSILGDIVMSVIAGVLVTRLYKVFGKVRNMKPTRVQKERMV